VKRGLGTAFTFMLVLDTLGAVVGAGTSRPFLPPPRMYLATWVLYAILGLVSGFGPGAARFATRLGWVIVLGALLGNYGKVFLSAVNATANAVAEPTS